MKEILASFIKVNAGPLAFLLIAWGLCSLLPQEEAKAAIYLVIGAALTRVKRTDGEGGGEKTRNPEPMNPEPIKP